MLLKLKNKFKSKYVKIIFAMFSVVLCFSIFFMTVSAESFSPSQYGGGLEIVDPYSGSVYSTISPIASSGQFKYTVQLLETGQALFRSYYNMPSKYNGKTGTLKFSLVLPPALRDFIVEPVLLLNNGNSQLPYTTFYWSNKTVDGIICSTYEFEYSNIKISSSSFGFQFISQYAHESLNQFVITTDFDFYDQSPGVAETPKYQKPSSGILDSQDSQQNDLIDDVLGDSEHSKEILSDNTDNVTTTYGGAFGAVASAVNYITDHSGKLLSLLMFSLSLGIIPLIVGMSINGLKTRDRHK